MPLGAILVQPQKLQRTASTNADAALIQDLLTLLAQLTADVEQSGQLLAALSAAWEATVNRLQQRALAGFATAQQKLRSKLAPLLNEVQSLSQLTLDVDNPAAGLALARQALQQLSQLVHSLSLDQVRTQTAFLLEVLQQDLGLTGDFIQAEVWGLIDGLIEHLEQLTPEMEQRQRDLRLAVACVLRRIKRRFQAQFVFPQLEAEFVARELLALLRRSDIASILHHATCALDGLAETLAAGITLSELSTGSAGNNGNPAPPAVPSKSHHATLVHPFRACAHGGLHNVQPVSQPRMDPFRAPRSVMARGAGEAVARADPPPADLSRYAWYATWLLQYKYRDLPLLGKSDLKDARRLAQRLKNPQDAVSRFLRDRLADQERQAIDAYDGSSAPSEALQLTMLDTLNRLLRGEATPLETAFYYDERFPGSVTISQETREVGEKFAENKELIRFNRMVLEDALPEELERLPRSLGSRFGAWLGEFIRETSGWPGDRVAVDREGKRVLLGDKILFTGDNVQWHQAPIFNMSSPFTGQKYYIFRHISPNFLDAWTLVTSVIWDAVRTVWHNVQTQPNHRVAPILNGLYDLGHGITSVAARKPISGFDFFGHKYLDWTLGAPLLLTTLGSIQGRHTEASFVNQLAFWFTVWLTDVINLVGPISATNTVHNAALSFMTLLNMGGPRDGSSELPAHPAENHKELQGIVDLSIFGFSYLLATRVSRQDYVNPGGAPGNVWLIWLLGGLGMGLLAGLVGTVVAEIIAWAEDWKLLGLTMLKSIPKGLVNFWPLLYSAREGDTDGGRFNPAGGPFQGYPGKQRADGTATPSPYFLPYAAGTTLFCGQGNAGMWSHNRIFNPTPAQTYAFDFGHDQGQEVLASRPGTVVSFSEGTPDDTTGTWNNIVIRHDVDDNGNPVAPDPDHDRDVSGNVVVTYAVYGHGRQNGVTNAFARWDVPVPTANIVGTRVRRGQPIMLAGDTGTSFHNHLHMHVQAETPGSPPQPPVADNRNNAYTIPFIFQDVDGDGVCQHGKWYTSNNTRRTS
jgi:hypothetical protein